ncbi:meiosis 1 arrest protein-like [Branchiostoma floridae]|uniref:Meiosis 1 arrest protein-like n=1 Tax=Branchiostoma floridae TaxID=7739 RepID=A0A9J7MLI9_BRAFL|nr:meiosis 1 arrest protein-like [Branchiostoma floridae]
MLKPMFKNIFASHISDELDRERFPTMNKQQLTWNQFARQPAHVVLVDFSPPFGSESCCQVQQALQDILALAANITGPPRVPFFGLFAIGTYPEALLPLQAVRGNLSKIHTALQELLSFQREGLVGGKTAGCLGQGLQDAMAQFKRQQHLYKQLELMVVTCRPSNIVNKEVERACSVLDMDVLKKVQVVCMSQPEDLGASDLYMLDDSPGSTAATESEGGLNCGMVDVVHLDNDGVSLHQFLKGWLVDSGTDREHLHITLPGMAGLGALTLKCDLSERILDPTHLLQPLNFALAPDMKGPSSTAQSRTTGSAAPVYKLTAVKLVNAANICESVVYGMPLVVTATSCWKLDWEELESNQTNFHALCHMLQEKGLAILATRDPPPGQNQQKSPRPSPRAHFLLLPSQSTSLLIKAVAVAELLLPCDFIFFLSGLAILATRDPSPGQNQNQQKSPRLSPRAHFLLLPSQSTSLLIKAVAVGELLLPCDFISPSEAPAQEAMDIVESAMAQLEVEEMLNPLLVKSGLYSCLTPHVRQTTATPGQQGKRRFQYTATSQVPQSAVPVGSRHAPQQTRVAQTNQAATSTSQRGAPFKRPENNQRGRFCPPKAKKSRVFDQDDMFPDFTPDF